MAEDNGPEWIPIGGGDDLPDGLKEILQQIIGQSIHSKDAHDPVASDMKPAVEQFGLGPGDLCFVAEGDAPAESASEQKFQLARILDPEEFAESYPDWETRLMNSFVLAHWYGEENEHGEFGWFPRAKLIKIEEWQWDELFAHNFSERYIEVPCLWITERYNDLLAGLGEANPQFNMPIPLVCGECGRRTVLIELSKTSKQVAICGSFPNRETKRPGAFWAISNILTDEYGHAKLSCLACDAKHEINLDQYDVYID